MYFENSVGWIYIENKAVTAVSITKIIRFNLNEATDLNRFFADFVDHLKFLEVQRMYRLNQLLDDD